MKRNLLQVAVVSVLLLMGCTGCDDTLSGATDVTAQREVLTTFSWVAEESYTLDTEPVGAFTAQAVDESGNLFFVTIYATAACEQNTNSAFISYEDDVATFLCQDGTYSLRITSTEAGGLVLSLTSSDEVQLFFVPQERGGGV